MASTIKFALVGGGRIAERHIDALRKIPSAELIAVCDLDPIRMEETRTKAHVPGYCNYHVMLTEHPAIDVVTLLTPTGMHYEHGLDILTQHRKHLFIEKPLVLKLSQAGQLKAKAKEYNLQIFPIYQNRFNKAVQKVKTAILDEGELGTLRVGTVRVRWCRPQRYYDLSPWRGTWAMDGGALSNQGIHYLDLLRYLCGPVKRVNALLKTLGATIEVEDTAVVTVEFESGAVGVIEIMTSARQQDFEASISCVGSEGLAVIGGIASNQLTTYSPDPSLTETCSEDFPTVYGYGHDQLIQGITETLLEGADPLIDFSDGVETIKLLHAIYRSHETGDWVSVADGLESAYLGQSDESIAALYRTPAINEAPVV